MYEIWRKWTESDEVWARDGSSRIIGRGFKVRIRGRGRLGVGGWGSYNEWGNSLTAMRNNS